MALADEPAIGFWIVDVAKLEKAVEDYGALNKIHDPDMSLIAECSGRFGGKDCDFHLRSETLSLDISAKSDGSQLDYRAVLGWGKVKRAALVFDGSIKVDPTWSLPDGWENRKQIIVFRRLNLTK